MKPLATVALTLGFAASAGLGGDAGNLDHQLVDAAALGNRGLVEALVAAGADPNAAMDGYPALQVAVRNGAVEVIKALIADGADVNAFGNRVPGCCQELDTALHQAVRSSPACSERNPERCAAHRLEIFEVLLAAGAEVDAADRKFGASPLALAVERGDLEVAQLLVAAGASVTVPDWDGLTSLHRAAAWNASPMLATMLLNAGSDIRVRDSDGTTPLHLAAK